jgi:zona occludens toxin (predicted ATPase)
MERSSRGHLKDRKGWSHNHKGIRTDQDTMIEQGMYDAKKTRDEIYFGNKRGRDRQRRERERCFERVKTVLLWSNLCMTITYVFVLLVNRYVCS